MNLEPEDLSFVDRAIRLAYNGDARVFPNPRVGAVIVRDGQVLGEGWHQVCGEAHAEVMAIKNAGGQVRGATAYVSLEPCGHEGRTPSCAKLLIEKGVAKVVYAVPDPGPGEGGGALLRGAGLEVISSVIRPGALEVLEPFMKNMLLGQTYFLSKWAMTMDGRMALGSGDSKWVSGESSRERVHRTRTSMDGIMVGAGTILADDPSLDVRFDLMGPSPRPIVWDPKGRTVDSQWWQKQKKRDPVVMTSKTNMNWPNFVEVIFFDEETPQKVSTDLFKLGIHGVLVEGGAGLHGWMFDHQMVDAVEVYIAPKICGGADSLSPVGGRGANQMSQALAPSRIQRECVGEDMLVRGWLKGYHPHPSLYESV